MPQFDSYPLIAKTDIANSDVLLIWHAGALYTITYDELFNGLIIPQYTTAERNAIAAPVEGQLINNVTSGQAEWYHLGAWGAFGGSTGGGGGATDLNGLTDVVITTPAGLQFVAWSDTDAVWENRTLVQADVSGLVSALAGKQPLNSNLTAISGLTSAADKLPYFTGSGTAALTSLTSFARTLIGSGSASSARVALQLDNVTNDAQVKRTEMGAASGVATLDGGGKVPITQLPSSLMEYQGTWDASTNSPTLTDGVGDTGDYYRVTIAGTQNLGSGSQTFRVGDWIMYNGTEWQRSGASDAVSTVFGRSGSVAAASGDYTAAQVTNVPAGNIAATTVQDALNELDTEKLPASYLDTDATLSLNSDAKVPSQKAVKAYAQPLDTELTALAGVTSAADALAYFTGLGTAAVTTLTSFGRTVIAAADLAALKTILALVKADVGLGNVDNTSDANKPVSTAQEAAIAAKGYNTADCTVGATNADYTTVDDAYQAGKRSMLCHGTITETNKWTFSEAVYLMGEGIGKTVIRLPNDNTKLASITGASFITNLTIEFLHTANLSSATDCMLSMFGTGYRLVNIELKGQGSTSTTTGTMLGLSYASASSNSDQVNLVKDIKFTNNNYGSYLIRTKPKNNDFVNLVIDGIMLSGVKGIALLDCTNSSFNFRGVTIRNIQGQYDNANRSVSNWINVSVPSNNTNAGITVENINVEVLNLTNWSSAALNIQGGYGSGYGASKKTVRNIAFFIYDGSPSRTIYIQDLNGGHVEDILANTVQVSGCYYSYIGGVKASTVNIQSNTYCSIVGNHAISGSASFYGCTYSAIIGNRIGGTTDFTNATNCAISGNSFGAAITMTGSNNNFSGNNSSSGSNVTLTVSGTGHTFGENRSITFSDTSTSHGISYYGGKHNFTGQLARAFKTLAAASTLTLDFDTAGAYYITMGANIGTITLSNGTDGMEAVVIAVQDATGNRTCAAPTNAIGWPTFSTGANAVDVIYMVYSSTLAKYVVTNTNLNVT